MWKAILYVVLINHPGGLASIEVSTINYDNIKVCQRDSLQIVQRYIGDRETLVTAQCVRVTDDGTGLT